MEAFSALLALCEGNSPVTGEFPTQRPVTRSFDVFFDLGLNKRLSKQSWGWWYETPSRSLWRHCNDTLWLLLTISIWADQALVICHNQHMRGCFIAIFSSLWDKTRIYFLWPLPWNHHKYQCFFMLPLGFGGILIYTNIKTTVSMLTLQ